MKALKFRDIIEIHQQEKIIRVTCQARQIFDKTLMFSEKSVGGQIIDRTYFCFIIRFYALQKSDLIIYRNKQFRIIKIVNHQELNSFLKIYAEESDYV